MDGRKYGPKDFAKDVLLNMWGNKVALLLIVVNLCSIPWAMRNKLYGNAIGLALAGSFLLGLEFMDALNKVLKHVSDKLIESQEKLIKELEELIKVLEEKLRK